MAVAPLTVRVTDAQGRGVRNATVSWTVTAGGGSLSSASTTNSDGEAAVFLTAGAAEGDNTVSASVESFGFSPATFTVSGVAPAAVARVGGDGQSARVSQPLAAPLVVRVTAGDGGAVPGLPVSWQVTAGGGMLSAISATTDADGRASAALTLGPMSGGNSVSAAPDGQAAVTCDATGSTPVSVQVVMEGIAFVAPPPGGDDITIMLGDTVRWVNQENVAHTATSESTPAGGATFDSGLLGNGDSFTFVPNIRGLWIYFCAEHPLQMQDARITVE